MSVVLVLCLYAVPGFEPQAPQWDDYEAELDAKDTPATDSERDAKLQEFLLHQAKFESTLKAYLVVRDELLNAVDVNARRKALTSLRSEFNATKQQEDAQQFLLWLANGHPLFSSVRSVTLRCTSCDAMQTTLDKDAGLWLEPKPGETLKDCFMKFAQGEHVDRNCTICGGSRAQKTDAVLALPPIMVFQLKQQRDARLQLPLQFPTELSATDLRPLTTNELADMELIGVVFYRQYGRERGHSGHYTVAIRSRRADGTWLLYDSRTTPE
jgi:ubiquitin C-terminal hydrolase